MRHSHICELITTTISALVFMLRVCSTTFLVTTPGPVIEEAVELSPLITGSNATYFVTISMSVFIGAFIGSRVLEHSTLKRYKKEKLLKERAFYDSTMQVQLVHRVMFGCRNKVEALRICFSKTFVLVSGTHTLHSRHFLGKKCRKLSTGERLERGSQYYASVRHVHGIKL